MYAVCYLNYIRRISGRIAVGVKPQALVPFSLSPHVLPIDGHLTVCALVLGPLWYGLKLTATQGAAC